MNAAFDLGHSGTPEIPCVGMVGTSSEMPSGLGQGPERRSTREIAVCETSEHGILERRSATSGDPSHILLSIGVEGEN